MFLYTRWHLGHRCCCVSRAGAASGLAFAASRDSSSAAGSGSSSASASWSWLPLPTAKITGGFGCTSAMPSSGVVERSFRGLGLPHEVQLARAPGLSTWQSLQSQPPTSRNRYGLRRPARGCSVPQTVQVAPWFSNVQRGHVQDSEADDGGT
jgi:hypothetical protein